MKINQKVLIKENISAEAFDARSTNHPDRVGIIYSILEDAQRPMFLVRQDTDILPFPLGAFMACDLEVLEEVC